MKLFVFAGEVSADIYGSRIVKELQKITPCLSVHGVGSSALDACGQHKVLSMEAFQTMGYSDVIRRLPTLYKHFHTVKNAILDIQPDIVLFIDSPALSIRMAATLRAKGYKGKIVQLVAPTVWAYKKKRVDAMARSFDLLLTLFDFEPAYFQHTSLKTVFVGHPIVECIQEAKKEPDVLHFTKPTLALFAGSRPDEIKRNLPLQLQAAEKLKQMMPDLEVVVQGRDVAFANRYELMRKCHAAIGKCGTVTLELALHSVPTVVTYELTFLNRLITKYLLKLDKMPYYAICNIVAKKELVKECIRPPVVAEKIALHLFDAIQKPYDGSFLYKKLQTNTPPSTYIAEILHSAIFS